MREVGRTMIVVRRRCTRMMDYIISASAQSACFQAVTRTWRAGLPVHISDTSFEVLAHPNTTHAPLSAFRLLKLKYIVASSFESID